MGNIPLLAAYDEQEKERRLRKKRRPSINRHLIRQNVDAFNMSGARFIATFRLSKEAVHYIILGIGPALQPKGGPRKAFVPVPNRILCALYFLVNGNQQGAISNNVLSCMSQASVSRFITLVTKALVQWGQRHIKFPVTDMQKATIKQRFREAFGLPGIVGCVDGTQIAIVTPPGREDAYLNHMGYYSINTQIVCDYDLRIRNVVAKYPGSTPDALVWRNSRIASIMSGNYANGDLDSKLLGDCGYPLSPWLLTPFPNPEPDSYQSSFNDLHAQGLNCVKRCIGLLKGRYQCLLRDHTLYYRPQAACRIIMACAILHNIAIMYKMGEVPYMYDEIDREPPQDPPLQDEYQEDLSTSGHRVREEYALDIFS